MANANSFLEMSRSLRLYVPDLPITLAQQFIRDRYRRILRRRDWSGLRRESQFLLNAFKTAGHVAFTRGSTSITGTGTSFAAGDIGRQFKAGTGSPVYTITNVVGQVLTLNMPIGTATATASTYFIMDAYVIPPADFSRFLVVSNPIQGWRLHLAVTQAELNSMDPQRTFMGQPYAIVDRMYNIATAGADNPVPQYEAWPYASTDQTLFYIYLIQGADLINDDDVPVWPINSDAIVSGALADVVRWPGTVATPNPYFTRPEYWKSYEAEYEDKLIEVERRDEEIYLTMLEMFPTYGYPMAPFTFSGSYLQSHAI
jgi:hypothetical protein